jgi:tetratricopeptide (TPR) repeat protein
MKIFALLVFCVIFPVSFLLSQGNEHDLANMYYSNGEYDKALTYYEQLYKRSDNTFYLERLVDCYVRTENLKEPEKILRKHLKKNPADYVFGVYLGVILEKDIRTSEADKLFKQFIDDLQPTSSAVIDLTNAFKQHNKLDWALQALQKGRKMLKDRYPFNYQFAEIYGTLGRTAEMIDEYIGLIEFSAAYKGSVQNVMTRYLSFDDGESKEYEIFREKLVERVQKKPDEKVYAEMLIWLYMQRGNFASALIQAKALDKRSEGLGKGVLELGRISKNASEFRTAKNAFRYVMDLGADKPYYLVAESELMNTMFTEITKNRSFNTSEIAETEAAYRGVINRLGKKSDAYTLYLELAEILAFYSNKPEEAKKLVEEALTIGGLAKLSIAKGKMLLGDIEVLLNNIWEASLLYMQVDADFKHDAIGAEAKFKNARIFYFDGEFKFAQSQLDVLKASTSKLIANDAMKLSLLITDNLGLDSNYTAMRQFANADLLLEQHRYREAFQLYDSILTYFPFHGLADEVLMRKAKAMQQQGKWAEAIPYLEKVYTLHGSDILADDAVFQLGEIYEKHLLDKEKAKEWYRKILFEYKGSLHVVEARKRFRALTDGREDANP